jgi:isoquinoline 1-oxidoreductase beta subunit
MPALKRRHFLLGTAATLGALVVGWSASPTRQRLTTAEPLPAMVSGQVALNGWVKVSPDDTVTLMMAAAEMGQGIHTGLAMLLAEEMDADLAQLRLEQAGYDPIYNNQAALLDNLPMFKPDDDGALKRGTRHVVGKLLREVPGLWGSGGSSGIVDQWLPLREAGASARAMLVGAAAAAWGVPAAECEVAAGRVSHPASQRSARFGELAARAATLPLPAQVVLKDPSRYTLIGRPVHRLDSAPKLDGSARYGLDALPPDGLLYATLAMCPTLGGRVARFDDTAARAMPGVRKVVALAPVGGGLGSGGMTSGAVAVIADTPWHAMRALDKVAIDWDHGAAASLSSRALIDQLAQSLDAPDQADVHLETGDADAAMKSAERTIEAEYRVPFIAHATMEPMNCTVQFKDGAATVWVGVQGPGMLRGGIAKVLGIEAAKVDIRLAYLGGGFGRRYLGDFVMQAAALARETDGMPVQLMWSREQDMAHDYYRPAYVARSKAGFDAQGRLVAWRVDTAGSSLGSPAFLSAAAEGTATTAYRFANARVAHRTMESAVTVGIWRSVNHSQNGFFTESFIDECAHAAGQGPVAFRRALLAGSPAEARHLGVLQRVTAMSGWGTPLAPEADGTRRARGLALHRSFGSVVAQVAEVSLTPERQIRVRRMYCAVDCGLAVNPNLVRQQMESAIVFGLSAALHGEITIERGQVQQSNFHDYAPLRMNECPQIEIAIVPSSAPPTGVGEPGTPPVAPAVANAVFALTGQRLRSLPLRLA